MLRRASKCMVDQKGIQSKRSFHDSSLAFFLFFFNFSYLGSQSFSLRYNLVTKFVETGSWHWNDVCCIYLRDLIVGAVTSRANFVIWCIGHLTFDLETPNGSYPRVFFAIHKTYWDALNLAPEQNKLIMSAQETEHQNTMVAHWYLWNLWSLVIFWTKYLDQ